ncbi:MAG: tetratricopeptide repeat protein [Candidatus Eremiobacteraeota bacterium]|nr:tetratricopeptide repeat protein [Candidatus Eremiobacteraeota bacterium]
MSRGPRGPRKRTRPAKPRRPEQSMAAYDDDDEGDLRDTPEYRKRQAIIRFGTGILLVAFLSTSGITCIASNMGEKEAARQQQEQTNAATNGTAVNALDSEIARYQDEMKKKPGDSETQRLLAQCLVLRARSNSEPVKATKDMEEARGLFEALVKAEPENMQAWIGLGNVDGALKSPDKSLEAFNKALELAKRPIAENVPDKDSKQSEAEQVQLEAHVGLAQVQLNEKKYEESLANLDAALKINPGAAEAYLLRGRLQMARKQPEAARRDFGLARDIAMQLPPGNPDQSNIMSQYIAAMRILDPKSLEAPPASATPISVPVPVASATPVTPTNTTVGNTTAPPVNVTAPVNGTNP